jgi:hypothetical protein
VLAELGVCPFKENVRDGSMCVCGLPALNHDEVAARIVLADHPAIARLLATAPAAGDGLRERVEALADEWAQHPEPPGEDYEGTQEGHWAFGEHLATRQHARDLRAVLGGDDSGEATS